MMLFVFGGIVVAVFALRASQFYLVCHSFLLLPKVIGRICARKKDRSADTRLTISQEPICVKNGLQKMQAKTRFLNDPIGEGH